jgi:type II secretory pathway pseudopilin PulG
VFAYVLLLIGVLSLLSGALLGNSLYIVRRAEHAKASRYAEVVAEQSTALYLLQARLAVAQAGVPALNMLAGDGSGLSGWNASGRACDVSVPDCPFTYAATVLPGSSSDALLERQQPNDVAMNLQQSYMGEQRVAVRLEVGIVGKGGEVLARRVRLLTLRTFTAEPWVMISGNKEDVAHTSDDASAQGDTGGVSAQPGDLPAPDPRYPDAYRDTRVHITVRCLNDGVAGGKHGDEGLGGVQVSCASAPSPAPADAFLESPKPWFNSDVGNPGGWSK